VHCGVAIVDIPMRHITYFDPEQVGPGVIPGRNVKTKEKQLIENLRVMKDIFNIIIILLNVKF
jgi:hypothetical protein